MKVIKFIVTHARCHFDELLALWLLATFGRHGKLLGVHKAQIVLVTSDKEAEKWAKNPHAILVGIGGGAYDEHREGSKSSRLEGECAATLVASALAVRDLRGVKELCDAAQQADAHSGVRASELPEFVKVMYGKLPEPLVRKHVTRLIEMLYKQFTEPKAVTHIRFSEAFDGVKGAYDERCYNYVTSVLQQAKYSKRVLDMPAVLTALKAHGEDGEDAEFLRFFIEMVASDQTKVWKEYDRIIATKHVLCKQDGLKVLFVRSDDEHAHRACRMHLAKPDVHIVRQTNGQFQVYADKPHLKLDRFVSMLRWLALPVEGKLPIEVLACAGEHPHVPELYFDLREEGKSCAVYNGTLTHRGVKPLLLAPQVILEALFASLDDRKYRAWLVERGIRLPAPSSAELPRKRGAQPLRNRPASVVVPPADPKNPLGDLEQALTKKG